MQFYVDRETGQFVSDPLFKAPVDSYGFKRGDAANINLKFVQGNTVVALASGAQISFGIKESGKYDGGFLVFTNAYADLSGSYSIAPNFNTEALNAALLQDGNDSNDVASLNAMLQGVF